MTQETQTEALCQPRGVGWGGRWEGGSKGRDYMYAYGGSLVAQMVKSLPAVWETQVRSVGQEDPLEKEMATHSSILAWKIPRMEEPGIPWGHKYLDTTEQLHFSFLWLIHVEV